MEQERENRFRSRCVKSNNLQSFQEMQHDIAYAAQTFGLEKLGFLTVTSAKRLPAREMIHQFREGFKQLQEQWDGPLSCIYVVDQDRNGRPHIHATVFGPDLGTGFNHLNYEQMKRLNEKAKTLSNEEKRTRDRLGKELNANANLKRMWISLKKCFTGRSEITPVRIPEAVSRYMTGRYCACLRGMPSDGKRLTLIGRLGKFPKNPVRYVSPGKIWYRRYLDIVMGIMGLDLSEMAARFDGKWKWQLTTLGNFYRKLHGSDFAVWPSKELKIDAWRKLELNDTLRRIPYESPGESTKKDFRRAYLRRLLEKGDLIGWGEAILDITMEEIARDDRIARELEEIEELADRKKKRKRKPRGGKGGK